MSTSTILLLTSCASSKVNKEDEALLPEIDVLQMKENTDAALRLSQQSKMDIDAIHTRLSELERMTIDLNNSVLSLPLARMEELENKITLLTEEIGTLKKVIATSGKIKTFNTSGKIVQSKKHLLEPPPSIYKKATQYFHSKEYIPAIALFQKVADDAPQGNYADDCYFWIGESHYNLGDYAKAITAYQKVFSYIDTEKGDNAQYKLGQSFLKLGDKKQAINEFKKLIVLYPDSDYVKKSRLELQKLGVK